MIELTNSVTQTVQLGATATFDTTICHTGRDACHRCGSGLVQLQGQGTNCPARYHIAVSGNIGGAAATQGNVAIALDGEALPETIRVATFVADTDVFPFAAQTNICECGACCNTVSIKNVGTTPITLSNLSFSVRRTC